MAVLHGAIGLETVMQGLRSFILFGLIPLLLLGCGCRLGGKCTKSDDPSTSKQGRMAGPLELSDKIDDATAAQVIGDFARLASMSFNSSPSDDYKLVFGSDSISVDYLLGWLKERVSYLLDEGFSSKDLVILYSDYSYGDISVKPGSGDSSVMLLAINLGSAIYSVGKNFSKLIGVPFNGRVISVDSPRTGVVQLAGGLKMMQQLNFGELVNSFVRLETLFHEGRHSDGHGANLGFHHVICPDYLGAYAGSLACDVAVNGSYAVGAAVLNEFAKNCKGSECDSRSLEIMRLLVADSKSRLLSPSLAGGGAIVLDATPEKRAIK